MTTPVDWDAKMAGLAAAAGVLLKANRGSVRSDERDPEASLASPSDGGVVPAMVRIDYEGADGELTTRDVTVRKVWKSDARIYFRGRCHMRRLDRTFRADRVHFLACLATGEIPDDPEDWLTGHALFDEAYVGPDGRGAGPLHLTMRAALPGVTILSFLARSDGFLDPDEVEVIVDYVMMSTTADLDRDACATIVGRLAPDDADLVEHFGYFLRQPERWERLTRAARRLVDADGQITLGEQIAWRRVSDSYASALKASEIAEQRRLEDVFGIMLRVQ